MDFNINDFFFLLEADDEDSKKDDDKEKKEDEKKDEKKDDDKKEKDEKDEDLEDSDEYNDLMGDDDLSDESDSDSDSSDSSDDDYNDLIGDDGDIEDDLGDLGEDKDDGESDYNTLIMVKGTDGAPDVVSGDVFEKLAKAGYAYTVLANNMKHIHFCACGQKFAEIHSEAERYYHKFLYMADVLFELASESPLVKLDNPTRAKEHCEDVEVEQESEYPFEIAMPHIQTNLSSAIDYIKAVRDAATTRPDIQSKMDEELAYLNKECNFIIRKKLQKGDASCGDFEPTTDVMGESCNWLFL